MSGNLGQYDESAAPMTDFTPLPAAEYLAMVEESEVKPCKPDAAGRSNGERLNLKWRVLEGENQGRIVFHGINIRHVNQKAQEIGQRELASLRQATGVLSARDSSEFHGVPCLVKVGIQPAGVGKDGVYRDARNEVKAIKSAASAGQASAPAATVAHQPAPQQAAPYVPTPRPAQYAAPVAGAGGKPPWSTPKR